MFASIAWWISDAYADHLENGKTLSQRWKASFSPEGYLDIALLLSRIRHGGNSIEAIIQAKAAVNKEVVAAQDAIYNQPGSIAQIQAREADIVALMDLARALDKKEALLIELRHVNDELSRNEKDGCGPLSDLGDFRKQYTMVLMQLRDANDQVASSLLNLRERNAYPGSSMPPCQKPVENFKSTTINQASFNAAVLSQDSVSNIMDTIENSKQKAKTMVDVAVQAACSLKEGEDAFSKIGEALGLSNKISTFRVNENSTNQGSIPNDVNEMQFPSDLITHCVATLSMIQNCAQRQQYQPAEVVQVLDSALASLRPCSPQNMPVYREIETCMGIIKNQLLALIPTAGDTETSSK